MYEGYGASGVAVIVEALTDNRNRTAGEVRHTFAKNDGNLGTSGAVAWLFERRGIVIVEADGADEDDLTLAAAEGGADDVTLDGSTFQVLSAPEPPRLPSCLANAARTSAAVLFRLSVRASTITATPLGP